MIKAIVFDYFGVISPGSSVDWELLGYIKDLKTHYKTAILSNVYGGFLEKTFDENHPQQNYFNELIASAEIGVLKPDPRAYQITCEKLGVDPKSAIFVDDSPDRCRGAEAIGMQAIIYQNLEQFKKDLGQILTKQSPNTNH